MDVPISLMGSLMNLYLKRNWTHTNLLTSSDLQGAGLGQGLGKEALVFFHSIHCSTAWLLFFKYWVPVTFTILKKLLKKGKQNEFFKGKWSECKWVPSSQMAFGHGKEASILVLGDLWSLPPLATHIYSTSAKRMNTTQLMGVLLNYYIWCVMTV